MPSGRIGWGEHYTSSRTEAVRGCCGGRLSPFRRVVRGCVRSEHGVAVQDRASCRHPGGFDADAAYSPSRAFRCALHAVGVLGGRNGSAANASPSAALDSDNGCKIPSLVSPFVTDGGNGGPVMGGDSNDAFSRGLSVHLEMRMSRRLLFLCLVTTSPAGRSAEFILLKLRPKACAFVGHPLAAATRSPAMPLSFP